MVVRVVVAVLLATALLGYALPAVEQARDSRADALAQGELRSFDDAVTRFVATNEPAPPGVADAGLVVEVHVPRGTTLAVGVGPRDESLAWTRPGRRGWVGSVRTAVAFAESLRLREAGRHRLELALVRTGDGPTVQVRTLKRDAGRRAARVRTRIGPRLSV